VKIGQWKHRESCPTVQFLFQLISLVVMNDNENSQTAIFSISIRLFLENLKRDKTRYLDLAIIIQQKKVIFSLPLFMHDRGLYIRQKHSKLSVFTFIFCLDYFSSSAISSVIPTHHQSKHPSKRLLGAHSAAGLIMTVRASLAQSVSHCCELIHLHNLNGQSTPPV
jgi:hypothetical protein